MRRAPLVLLAACAAHPRPQAPAKPSGPWAVAFERSLRNDYAGPSFTSDGGVVASGERFDAQGRYLGMLAMEIPGGRALSSVRAILRDGSAIATLDDDRGNDDLIVGAPDQDPEKATARVHGVTALAISADQQRVAAYDDHGIHIWSLPALKPIAHIDLANVYAPAIALPPGAIVYAVPCRGAGCAGDGLAIRDGNGKRILRDAGITGLAFSPTGDAAILDDDKTFEIISLPDGTSRGTIAHDGALSVGTMSAGALAIAPGGGTVAAVTCKDIDVWSATASGWTRVYHGHATHGNDQDGCLYPSGLAFSPDGTSLAIGADDLTVLRPGVPRIVADPPYQPKVPQGWSATDDVHDEFMTSPGTGLAARPHVLGEWHSDAAGVRAVARDAFEMSKFATLDAWSHAILDRFESMDGDSVHYQHAYVDERGRRVFEYTLLLRGGCDEMDRHVRWVEDGDELLEIDIEAGPGWGKKKTRAWMQAFFDAPTGDKAPADRKIASASYFTGGC